MTEIAKVISENTVNTEQDVYDLLEDETTVNIADKNILKSIIKRNLTSGKISIENGSLNKKCNVINIDDTSAGNMQVYFSGWLSGISNSTLSIKFNSGE